MSRVYISFGMSVPEVLKRRILSSMPYTPFPFFITAAAPRLPVACPVGREPYSERESRMQRGVGECCCDVPRIWI